jgi:hypothetical protein
MYCEQFPIPDAGAELKKGRRDAENGKRATERTRTELGQLGNGRCRDSKGFDGSHRRYVAAFVQEYFRAGRVGTVNGKRIKRSERMNGWNQQSHEIIEVVIGSIRMIRLIRLIRLIRFLPC